MGSCLTELLTSARQGPRADTDVGGAVEAAGCRVHVPTSSGKSPELSMHVSPRVGMIFPIPPTAA